MMLKGQAKRFALAAKMWLIALSAVGLVLPVASAAHAEANVCRDRAVVTVNGMACPFCAYGLRKELLTLPGVKEVRVDLNKSQATLDVREGSDVKNAEIEQAVRKAGFTPGSIQCDAGNRVRQTPALFKSAEFNIVGMQCENCAANVTAALTKERGVHSVAVDLTAKRATVTYDPQQVKPAALTQAIEHAGKFQAALTNPPDGSANANWERAGVAPKR